MKLYILALFFVLAEVQSAPSSREKILALRDALNKIIKDNGLEAKACPYHSCSALMFEGCYALKQNENGCELCECDSEVGPPVACQLHSCNAENMGCGDAGQKYDSNDCPLCECNNKDTCTLLPETGPCRSKIDRFYFDSETNSCQKFFYGGCQGNENNFETLEKCSETCGKIAQYQESSNGIVPCPMHSCSAEAMGCPNGLATNENGCPLCECAEEVQPPVACQLHSCSAESMGCGDAGQKYDSNDCPLCECNSIVIGSRADSGFNKDTCTLLPETGPCRSKIDRFYFDSETNSCQKFFYGGCQGNENNFETLEKCSETCGKIAQYQESSNGIVPCPMHSCSAEAMGCSNGLATNENGCPLCECEKEVQPPAACQLHSCSAENMGCGAAGQKYDSNDCPLCECNDKDTCTLLPETGPCRSKIDRFYFDSESNSCQKFFYGGCQGNENNFETLEKCSETCGKIAQYQESSNGIVPCPMHSCSAEAMGCPNGLATNENGCPLCECAEEVQPPVACQLHSCSAESMGCGDAGQKYDSNDCPLCECNSIVIGSRADSGFNKDTCTLLPETGPCRSKIDRFYFDSETNSCQKFFYGGCQGNENNFETLEKCSATCGNGIVPCPMHSCLAEAMDCPTGKLRKNELGCDLCECEVVVEPEPEEPIACLYHGCTAEMLGCVDGLATMDNGCELCECKKIAVVACPLHSCNAEMLGCEYGLATNENGCPLCECQETETTEPESQTELSKCEKQRKEALAMAADVADGPMIPGCEIDGSYQSIQCYYDQCWCVVPSSGDEIKGTRTSIENLYTMKCDGMDPGKMTPESEKGGGELGKHSENKEIEALIEALQKNGIN